MVKVNVKACFYIDSLNWHVLIVSQYCRNHISAINPSHFRLHLIQLALMVKLTGKLVVNARRVVQHQGRQLPSPRLSTRCLS